MEQVKGKDKNKKKSPLQLDKGESPEKETPRKKREGKKVSKWVNRGRDQGGSTTRQEDGKNIWERE